MNIKDIFSSITPKYDFLNRFLSLRQDVTWRKQTVEQMRFFKSYKFLDMATGTGDLAIEAVRMHSKIEAIGLDFVQEMVNNGNSKIKANRSRESNEVQIRFVGVSGFLLLSNSGELLILTRLLSLRTESSSFSLSDISMALRSNSDSSRK